MVLGQCAMQHPLLLNHPDAYEKMKLAYNANQVKKVLNAVTDKRMIFIVPKEKGDADTGEIIYPNQQPLPDLKPKEKKQPIVKRKKSSKTLMREKAAATIVAFSHKNKWNIDPVTIKLFHQRLLDLGYIVDASDSTPLINFHYEDES